MKSLKSLIVGATIIASSLLAPKLQAQPANAATTPTLDYQNSVASVYLSNVLFNTALSSYAALKHKEPFWDHFWKGNVIGIANTTGRLMAARNENLVIPGKFLYNYGQSAQENLLTNKPWLSRFTMDVGPFVLEYDNNLEKNKFYAGVLPGPFIGTLAYSFNKNNSIDWEYTLKYLTPVFVDKFDPEVEDNYGISEFNLIRANHLGNNHRTMALNVMQAWDYRAGRKIHSIFVQPEFDKRKLKTKRFRKEHKYQGRLDEMKDSEFFAVLDSGKIEGYVQKPYYIDYKVDGTFTKIEGFRRQFYVDATFDIFHGLGNHMLMQRISGKMEDNPLYVNHWSLIDVKDK